MDFLSNLVPSVLSLELDPTSQYSSLGLSISLHFARPVFRCPIRTVKGAGPNGTDYTDSHLTGGLTTEGIFNLRGEFCPTNRRLQI